MPLSCSLPVFGPDAPDSDHNRRSMSLCKQPRHRLADLSLSSDPICVPFLLTSNKCVCHRTENVPRDLFRIECWSWPDYGKADHRRPWWRNRIRIERVKAGRDVLFHASARWLDSLKNICHSLRRTRAWVIMAPAASSGNAALSQR